LVCQVRSRAFAGGRPRVHEQASCVLGCRGPIQFASLACSSSSGMYGWGRGHTMRFPGRRVVVSVRIPTCLPCCQSTRIWLHSQAYCILPLDTACREPNTVGGDEGVSRCLQDHRWGWPIVSCPARLNRPLFAGRVVSCVVCAILHQPDLPCSPMSTPTLCPCATSPAPGARFSTCAAATACML